MNPQAHGSGLTRVQGRCLKFHFPRNKGGDSPPFGAACMKCGQRIFPLPTGPPLSERFTGGPSNNLMHIALLSITSPMPSDPHQIGKQFLRGDCRVAHSAGPAIAPCHYLPLAECAHDWRGGPGPLVGREQILHRVRRTAALSCSQVHGADFRSPPESDDVRMLLQ